MKRLGDLQFDNSCVRLPPDFYVRVTPTPLSGTHLVSVSPTAVGLPGLSLSRLSEPAALPASNCPESPPCTAYRTPSRKRSRSVW